MTFDNIVKIIEITISCIGLILVVFGWIIPYRQTIKMNKDKQSSDMEWQKILWEKELIDKQISELYGPLGEMILEQEILWSLILYQLGRQYIFSADTDQISQLPEDEQKIWIHYVNNYKIPKQMKMLELLQKNQHLIYKSEKPTCYRFFIEYVIGWELLDNQKRNGIPNYYEYYYKYNYPREFDTYIKNTLQVLYKRQSELVELSHLKSTAF